MPLSHVSAILEERGGHRFVIGTRKTIKRNTKKHERAFIVPDFLVREPVQHDQLGFVLGTAYRHMKATLDTESACGGCRQCCKTPRIDEINKPEHVLCPFSSELVGCKIHKSKPKSCAAFECLWLKSQRRNDKMLLELRPDKCGVYFSEDTSQHMGGTFDPLRIEAHEDHDTGVTNPEAVQRFVDAMSQAGWRFDKITTYHGAKI